MACRANFDQGIVGVHKQFLRADPFLDCSFILRAGRWDAAIRQEAVVDIGSDKKVKLCHLRGSKRIETIQERRSK